MKGNQRPRRGNQNVKDLFNNPDPRIRALTQALLPLLPKVTTHPKDLRKRLDDEAEAAQLLHERGPQ